MSRSLKSLRLLGVSLLAVLGLMAIGAAAAQAEDEFYINGTPLLDLGGEEEVEGTFGPGELLEEGNIKIACAGGSFNGVIKAHGLGSGEANFGVDEKCDVLETNGHCWVEGPIKATGEIEIALHEGGAYLILTGLGPGRQFAAFEISGDGLCAIEELGINVHGQTALLLHDPNTPRVVQTGLTIDLEEEKLVADGIFLGNNQAHFEAGTLVEVFLSGSHFGQKWNLGPLVE